MKNLFLTLKIIFDTIRKIVNFFSIFKEESFLNILIISILILYVCKAVVSFLIQAWIIKFTLNFEAWLRVI